MYDTLIFKDEVVCTRYLYNIKTIITFILYTQGVSYPTYHTAYETFHYVKKFIDPDFVFHRTMAQLFGEMLRRLADDVIIPMDARGYAVVMKDELKLIKAAMYFVDSLRWFKGQGKELLGKGFLKVKFQALLLVELCFT